MKLLKSEQIAHIDHYAKETLGISTCTLMGRAGEAVAKVVRLHLEPGATVIILAGPGNNGGDGYAAALRLASAYSVTVFDVFSSAQRTEEGQYYLARCHEEEIPVLAFCADDDTRDRILSAACLIDAVFGTGARGDASPLILTLASWIASSRAYKIAVDIPLGVNADDGTIAPYAYRADSTVALSFYKVGMFSYPAREYLGDLTLDTLGLSEIPKAQQSPYEGVDMPLAKSLFPQRGANTHKGSFGKLMTLIGSTRYRGAAHLALGAALRSGVGLTTFFGESDLVDSLLPTYPEALYHTDLHVDTITDADARHTATLVGCGSGCDEVLCARVFALLHSGASPLVLDADAINVLALSPKEGREALRRSTRPVILTPHPLELSRLLETEVSCIQQNRLRIAMDCARDLGVILVLKGAGTLTTDGTRLFVNTTGSSALAKGGSGDALAGLIGGLCASGTAPIFAAALGVFIHGLAGDRLADRYSTLGVTPSDLPLEMARVLGEIEKQ